MVKDQTDDFYKLSKSDAFFQEHNAFVGLELVPDTHRLCLMNLMLHGIEDQVGEPSMLRRLLSRLQSLYRSAEKADEVLLVNLANNLAAVVDAVECGRTHRAGWGVADETCWAT